MKRHRLGAPQKEQSSSEDEDDAFAALPRQKSSKRVKDVEKPPTFTAPTKSSAKKKEVELSPQPTAAATVDVLEQSQSYQPPRAVSVTSSMKRHHGALTDSRKAKMDALLEELQSEKPSDKALKNSTSSFVPQKKGSYVEAGEEHLTTNIFVGNLATHVTEEKLGDLFRQFGELYSIKIMWPRGEEARSKSRHTGFVCFMRRVDAEAAMNALDDTDPFASGRRLTMRWGKNILRQQEQQQYGPYDHTQATSTPMIYVDLPSDPAKERFITSVAGFVAEDGSSLENILMDRERSNSRFDFLRPGHPDHVYYKWRVYSFCQGDRDGRRSASFSMLQGGCLWIPPAVVQQAARSSSDVSEQEQPKRPPHRPPPTRADGSARLTPLELSQAHHLFRVQLSTSRQSICRAMAFCVEKTHATHHVASLLQELFAEATMESGTCADSTTSSDDGHSHNNNNETSTAPPPLPSPVSVETLISRLYLLSDVLFNAQQPVVKNAFLYRTVIEQMAPTIFQQLGLYSSNQQKKGRRFTRHYKLSTAVHVVLQAWSTWNVYHPSFLQQLQMIFDGKQDSADDATASEQVDDNGSNSNESAENAPTDIGKALQEDATPAVEVVREIAQGQWTEVQEEANEVSRRPDHDDAVAPPPKTSIAASRGVDDDVDGAPLDDVGIQNEHKVHGNVDGEPLEMDDDVDGEPLEEDAADDIDGEPIEDKNQVVAAEVESGAGKPVDPDVDGEPLDDHHKNGADDDDVDGEPLDDDEDVDGEPLGE